MEESFMKQLMSAMKCNVCGDVYQSADVKVLGHRENLWFLSVSCHSCHSQGLVAAVIKDGGDVPEVVTDLVKTERYKFERGVPVSGDDLLDLHLILDGFDGDFKRLFAG